MRKHNKELIHALADQGLTLTEIGQELGISPYGARAALTRVGRRAIHEMRQTVRQRAEGMKPADAVRYLLDQLDILTDGYASSGNHETDRFGLKLTLSQAKLFAALWDADGAILSKEALMDAMRFGIIGDEPDLRVIDVQICKMRPKIPTSIGRIETVWGRGFRFVRAPQDGA